MQENRTILQIEPSIIYDYKTNINMKKRSISMPTISFQIRKGEYVIPVAGEELNVFDLKNLVKNDAVVRSFSVSSQDGTPSGIFFRPDGTKMYMIGDTNDSVYSYTLSTPWNITTATYDGVNFSVSSQDTSPRDIFFKPDGTKMYVIGDANNRVYSYTLSTPWNIGTATYDNVSFHVGSQDGTPTGIFFRSDGTKMYVVGDVNDRVYSYTLSTPWDIGTVTYDNVYLSVGSQDILPQDIFFKSDGTKMYLIGSGNNRVYSYILSTPWNIGTAIYDGVNFYIGSQDGFSRSIFFQPNGMRMYMVGYGTDNVYSYEVNNSWFISKALFDGTFLNIGSQDTSPQDIFFKPDGTKMYLIGSGNNRVYSYTLSTPWNIDTATYDNVSFFVGSQDGTPSGIFFRSDGTKMYMIGDANNRVYSYTLSTPWNISTATYDNVSFDVSSQDSAPTGIFFRPDGTKMYVIGNNTDSIYSYTLSTPWNITTATYDNVNFSVTSQDGSPQGIFFRPDGTKMYVIGNNTDRLYSYTLSTPWNLGTAIYDSVSFYIGSQDNIPVGIFFKSDGTKMYMVGSGNDRVYSYDISRLWNIGTATHDNVNFSVSSQDASPQDIFFKPDGTKMYVVGSNTDRVYSYTLSTPWNLSTTIYDNVSFDVSSQDGTPTGIFFQPDGTKMYVVGSNTDRVYSYTLSTPWNIGTATYDNVSFDVSSQESNPAGIFFKPDGTKMYVIGSTIDRVHSYTLTTPWNLGTASYDNVFFSVVSQDGSPQGIFFRPDGKKMYVVGNSNNSVYSYTLSTPWNLSTTIYDNVSFNVSFQDGTPTGIFFRPDGTKMYVIGDSTDRVYSYTLI
jgi:DNA-binding beta-propeller fold protein YncE